MVADPPTTQRTDKAREDYRPANAPLNVDREAVRMLAVAIGVREAARRMNLNENTVKQWSLRFGWLDHLKEKSVVSPPSSMQKRDVPNIPNPVKVMEDAMLGYGKDTKLGLAEYASITTKHAVKVAKVDPDLALAQASDVASVAKTAAMVHGWGNKAAGSAAVVNISLLGMTPDQLTIDDCLEIDSTSEIAEVPMIQDVTSPSPSVEHVDLSEY